ncbi:hypothetical protein SEA_IGNACIO_31 [Streptomyces phage Ignacio]|nr:hypothetical protein QEN60_gp31 [Streptomyces phage Ignacio]YP_010756499.1 hypothetical protein QEN66_gp30 [Streptomyces phage Piccadilly]YP_010756557.1 membrane protein [Streptomyces phage Eastland]QKN87558.1 hypothetical protein SEA_IGNACIO_31 [Streptomyces phage Ignacio]UJQ86041.1 hypothetical protein SEA_PICCADILLY_30 [Streptomyces phage Piccadilly]URC18010.1 membrane protein [Streptomyces phage Eastland]
MSKKSVIAATIAVLVVVIGLTMQATAYVLDSGARAPYAVGLAVTATGFLGLLATAPALLTAIRTTAYDAAYLAYLADREHNRAAAATTPPALVRSIGRRAR